MRAAFRPSGSRCWPASRSAIGTIGTLLVTAPLAWASATIGWRATFLAVAGLVVVCAALVAIMVREDGDPAHPGGGETARESLRGVLEVARMRAFLPLFLMHAMSYSSYVLIVGLWGGPFLTHVYGYGLTARGDLLMLPAISHIVGVVVWGHAERFFGSYKPLVLAGACDRGGAAAARRRRPARAVLARRLARAVRLLRRLPSRCCSRTAARCCRRIWSDAG